MLPPSTTPPSGQDIGPRECPQGKRWTNGVCAPSFVKPEGGSISIPNCKAGSHLQNGVCVPNIARPGDDLGNIGSRRCPNGTYVSGRHSCPSFRPIKERIPPLSLPQPNKPRPLVSPDWRPKQTGSSTLGGGVTRPQTKTCPNGARVPLYSRCPIYRQPDTTSGASSGGYPSFRPKAPVNEGQTSARPRPITWPTQTTPMTPRPKYQNLNKNPAAPGGQSGGGSNRSGNWGFQKPMRTRSSEGGLFD